MVHFRGRIRDRSATIQALAVLPLQRKVPDLIRTMNLARKPQLLSHISNGGSIRFTPFLVVPHELTGDLLRPEAVACMLNVDNRRLSPPLRCCVEPPAHLLENAVDGRVTRRRADRLHGGLPVITDVELQAPSRMQINTVAKHPVGEATQGIQGIRGTPLGQGDLLELELILLGRLFKQLRDLVVDVSSILGTTGV